jgi:hypothetical protein
VPDDSPSRIGTNTVVKRLTTAFTITAGIGALGAVVFTFISGVQYRIREDQGLQPQYTAAWIVTGTSWGLWLCALGLAALTVSGAVALLRRRRRSAPDHTDASAS